MVWICRARRSSTTPILEDSVRVAALAERILQASSRGAGGNYDCADLYGETTGYGFASTHPRAGVGENYDWADETKEAGYCSVDSGSSRHEPEF